ncbi:hypothetical protein GGX14DRAFT_440100 [Mycena pura]|uniref:Uncharacterized protein n=1 Tax=Mycena pura TaxID=153505 RepID=A0AAD6YHU5_9AGAR|nr:hypothetical protein GGX14DRAFT_440100 [Mycena pura]
MNVHLIIKDSLPFDLVLGCDWHLFCRDSVLNAHFVLSSGKLDLMPQGSSSPCACTEPSACTCASSSNAVHSFKTPTTSLNILHDIFTARYSLIHHLVTGACADHMADVDSTSKLDRSTCCSIAQDFDSAASIASMSCCHCPQYFYLHITQSSLQTQGRNS